MSTPRQPTEEELIEALRRVKTDEVLLETVVTLVNLAGQKLAVKEARDPVEARKAIDAARTLVPLLPEDRVGPIRDALSQVQMMYVREAGAPEEAEAEGPDSAREEAERAKARAKIWTPGSP
ncbi:MAG TPA: hypothetical protein VK307_00960 [Thermoleophilaceae bacterium]|nr:hypothetical protein [Thermoleophilaceae bacterium]